MNVTATPCAMCDRSFTGRGNNGWPLVNGRVCDVCNRLVVLARWDAIIEASEEASE
jgi:hypothetical protein